MLPYFSVIAPATARKPLPAVETLDAATWTPETVESLVGHTIHYCGGSTEPNYCAASSRRRLVELYTNARLPDDGDEIIRRLDGVAPAFIKELARRAELIRLQGTSTSSSTLTAALDAMLEHATPVLRRTLAGPWDPDVE